MLLVKLNYKPWSWATLKSIQIIDRLLQKTIKNYAKISKFSSKKSQKKKGSETSKRLLWTS